MYASHGFVLKVIVVRPDSAILLVGLFTTVGAQVWVGVARIRAANVLHPGRVAVHPARVRCSKKGGSAMRRCPLFVFSTATRPPLFRGFGRFSIRDIGVHARIGGGPGVEQVN